MKEKWQRKNLDKLSGVLTKNNIVATILFHPVYSRDSNHDTICCPYSEVRKSVAIVLCSTRANLFRSIQLLCSCYRQYQPLFRHWIRVFYFSVLPRFTTHQSFRQSLRIQLCGRIDLIKIVFNWIPIRHLNNWEFWFLQAIGDRKRRLTANGRKNRELNFFASRTYSMT